MEKRTTVVADGQDLELLARVARERGISLGRLLGELVAKEAHELRRDLRPRLGTFQAEVSLAEAAEREEPAARAFRS